MPRNRVRIPATKFPEPVKLPPDKIEPDPVLPGVIGTNENTAPRRRSAAEDIRRTAEQIVDGIIHHARRGRE